MAGTSAGAKAGWDTRGRGRHPKTSMRSTGLALSSSSGDFARAVAEDYMWVHRGLKQAVKRYTGPASVAGTVTASRVGRFSRQGLFGKR